MDEKLQRTIDAYQLVGADPNDRKKLAAFYVRGDVLRPGFGRWDACDPIAHAILDVVQAQNELADAVSDYAEFVPHDTALRAAEENRRTAIAKLVRALKEAS